MAWYGSVPGVHVTSTFQHRSLSGVLLTAMTWYRSPSGMLVTSMTWYRSLSGVHVMAQYRSLSGVFVMGMGRYRSVPGMTVSTSGLYVATCGKLDTAEMTSDVSVPRMYVYYLRGSIRSKYCNWLRTFTVVLFSAVGCSISFLCYGNKLCGYCIKTAMNEARYINFKSCWTKFYVFVVPFHVRGRNKIYPHQTRHCGTSIK